MTLTIELTPEAKSRLQEAAQRAGLDIYSYVGRILAVDVSILPSANTIDLEEWEADLDELAAGSEDQPILPAEAFSRESIYADHD